MAKKRYYQSVKDRMAESRGMERYETKKKMRKDMPAKGVKVDAKDQYPYLAGSWLSFDESAPAGMPRNVKMVEAGSYQYGLDVMVPGNKPYMDKVQEEDHKAMINNLGPRQI